MAGALLELAGVHTHIGAYHILHGVDLAVPKGQLTMLLGRNGAGKTTTLRTIMGLWHASQGSIHFGGRDITAMNTPAIASSAINVQTTVSAAPALTRRAIQPATTNVTATQDAINATRAGHGYG